MKPLIKRGFFFTSCINRTSFSDTRRLVLWLDYARHPEPVEGRLAALPLKRLPFGSMPNAFREGLKKASDL
jgi:hypothetical protein